MLYSFNCFVKVLMSIVNNKNRFKGFFLTYVLVAQLVERRTYDADVTGSNPVWYIIFIFLIVQLKKALFLLTC